MSGKRRENVGIMSGMLGSCWDDVGIMLDLCRNHVGVWDSTNISMLGYVGQRWDYVGVCWDHVGVMLGLCWGMSGSRWSNELSLNFQCWNHVGLRWDHVGLCWSNMIPTYPDVIPTYPNMIPTLSHDLTCSNQINFLLFPTI